MLADVGRDLLHRTLGPLAERLSGVNPNVITLGGFCVSVISGFAFYLTDRHPAFFLVTAGLAIAYGLFDAFDGLVARLHSKTSAWGDFLDHACDRLAGVIVFLGVTATSHCTDVLGFLVAIGTLYHGFLGTQMEASFGFRVYRGIGIAEAILVTVVYSLTSFSIHAAGLPFFYDLPVLGGVRLSVTDTFMLCALPLIAIGIVQRFAIARQLARQQTAEPAQPRPVKPA